MKKYRNKIIGSAVVILLLSLAFLYGGNTAAPDVQTVKSTADTTQDVRIAVESEKAIYSDSTSGDNVSAKDESEALSVQSDSVEAKSAESMPDPAVNHAESEIIPDSAVEESKSSADAPPESGTTEKSEKAPENNIASEEVLNEYITITPEAPTQQNHVVAEDKSDLPAQMQTSTETDDTPVKELTCTLSVRCDTVLQNLDRLDDRKADILPKDGVIFAEKNVSFYEGESVFNLLMREMKQNKIHLEFENTPVYKSAYIEGIANLYEFDCGELSGWMYRVNGYFPNYGCSRYLIKPYDKIEWVYTCDLGADVGGDYSARNGKQNE